MFFGNFLLSPCSRAPLRAAPQAKELAFSLAREYISGMAGIILRTEDQIIRLLNDNLRSVSREAEKKVDEDFREHIDRIIKRLAFIYLRLNNLEREKLKDREFYSEKFFWQATNALIGSLQLIRQGYFIEPQVLQRQAIEYLSLILSFYSGKENFELFKKGKLTGEKSFSLAKKIEPQIGEIYGILSEVSHPSIKLVGMHIAYKNKTKLIGGGLVEEHLYRTKLNIGTLDYLLVIFQSSVELVFSSKITELKFWVRTSSRELKQHFSEEELSSGQKSMSLIQEALEELEKRKP